VFLALTLASSYFARRRQWLVSDSPAALTSATRFNGILLLPALAIESALLLAVVLLLTSVRWMRLSYQIYAWSQLFCPLTASWLISLPRLILVIFRLTMVMARLGKNEERQNALTAACAVGMGGLAAVFASGRWMF
jgi:hypothetical protein